MHVPGATPQVNPVEKAVEFQRAAHVQEGDVSCPGILGAADEHGLTVRERRSHAGAMNRDGYGATESEEVPDLVGLSAGLFHWSWASG